MFNKLELVNAFNDHCEYKFYTVGVCSSAILISVTDQQEVFNVEFIGGCPGNGIAVGRLVEGMKLEEVIDKLKGVTESIITGKMMPVGTGLFRTFYDRKTYDRLVREKESMMDVIEEEDGKSFGNNVQFNIVDMIK